ncbi:MAG: sulfite exporter TauE/SafE family protein [Cyanothece sp. SIO1E1]|nr:sulfite exporter TauE/SafE family protein [Cyanothece sp. SIO1E1]
MPENSIILTLGGLVSGTLAGLLGIGGGVLLVPLLVSLGHVPVQAAATSSLAILITSTVGSLQNWRMGYLSLKRVAYLGIPAALTAQLGTYLASRIVAYALLITFGISLLFNIYLMDLRKRLGGKQGFRSLKLNPVASRIGTGGAAGFMAGLFGVGGGVIMVPLQILLLGETLKVAVRTSLGVIAITAISACIGHATKGNVLFIDGLLVGFGGLLGVQFSTRYLPRLPDKIINFTFRGMLVLLSVYVFWQAWDSFYNQFSTNP